MIRKIRVQISNLRTSMWMFCQSYGYTTPYPNVFEVFGCHSSIPNSILISVECTHVLHSVDGNKFQPIMYRCILALTYGVYGRSLWIVQTKKKRDMTHKDMARLDGPTKSKILYETFLYYYMVAGNNIGVHKIEPWL